MHEWEVLGNDSDIWAQLLFFSNKQHLLSFFSFYQGAFHDSQFLFFLSNY